MTVKPCIKCGAVDRNARGDCRPCARDAVAKWRAANPEKIKTASAKYYAEHSDQARGNSATWKAANPKRVKLLDARWRRGNPEKVKKYGRVVQHRRRARKRAVGGSFTATEISHMLKSQKNKCAVCRQDISKSYHIDHIMPLALGGHNGITNIQLLCPFCNRSKHDNHPVDFMQSRGFLL